MFKRFTPDVRTAENSVEGEWAYIQDAFFVIDPDGNGYVYKNAVCVQNMGGAYGVGILRKKGKLAVKIARNAKPTVAVSLEHNDYMRVTEPPIFFSEVLQ